MIEFILALELWFSIVQGKRLVTECQCIVHMLLLTFLLCVTSLLCVSVVVAGGLLTFQVGTHISKS